MHNISDRMMWVEGCFYGKDMAVVVVYAPTEEAVLEDKIGFYENLDALMSSIPKQYEMQIVLGDCSRKMRMGLCFWNFVLKISFL